MKRYAHFAVLVALVVGLTSLPAFAGQAAPAGQGSSQAQAAAPKKEKKVNPKEEKAYKAFYEIKLSQPKDIVKKGQDFLKKYPDSVYAPTVYARMATAYQSLGDLPDMLDAGHKALQLDPDNVDVLSLLAYTIPRRINPSNLNSGQQLQEASQYATHALELLAKMQKPANLTDEQFTSAINTEAASCHSGLGLVAYYQHNIPGMVSELEQAVKLNPTPDPSDQYLLGLGYMQAGRAADAEDVLQKCSAEPGPLAERCKSSLDKAKQLAASNPKQ